MTTKRWLAHYPVEVPPTYEYPRCSIAQFLLQSAATYPHHTAMYFLGKKIPYHQLLTDAYRFAHALSRLGVRKGDRVAIMLPNCPQTVVAYFGTLLIGAVVVMTNPMYMPRELEHQLNDSGAKVLLTLDLLFERVSKVVPSTCVQHVVVTSIQDSLPWVKSLLYPLKVKRDGMKRDVVYSDDVSSYKALLKASPAAPIIVEVDAEHDLALIQYTGGTTGVAKGVMLTHYNLVANTIQSRLWSYRSREGKESYLAALPFFHVFGVTVLMNQSVYLAGTLVMLPRFDPVQVLEAIDRQRPTIFPGAPTMYIALLQQPKAGKVDLSSIDFCISGAASLPREVQHEFERLTGGRLIEGYGMTEASPVTHANNIWETRKPGSVGIPFPDTDCRVVDPKTGEELPVGEVGELIVSGPQVMKRYWGRPDETAKVLRDGWLYTGDLGRMDEDGFFYVIDRLKDLIIAGGFNIYPREVEEVLYEHPDVAEAVVAGVVDSYRGETVKAYIVLRQGATVDAAHVSAWCRERLAAYKVPKLYEFRESLPKSMVGKVLRRKLVEEEAERQRRAERDVVVRDADVLDEESQGQEQKQERQAGPERDPSHRDDGQQS
ncbi:long-chain fatty acid--CoA ligase [Paenibacillus sp. YYML68]|uniref:long-chain-fatty-acid--CoA ligase n=1 Tax=Paenibacillus sp. YYML68 TaxID=2909250 RepID=UPI002491CBBC|nr:long-chain fatty acid--CoA ligase [Paenibacillus sp. YYML68]